MRNVNSVGFGIGRTMGRTNSLGSFEWEVTGYIIGVDFYIVVLRLISFTDSFNTICHNNRELDLIYLWKDLSIIC